MAATGRGEEHHMRIRTACVMVAVVTVALSIGSISAASAARGTPPDAHRAGAADAGLFYTGNAYGTFAFVGSTVVAGKSALVSLGCTTAAGAHHTNTVGTVNAPGIVTTGVIDTTADSRAHGGAVTSRTSADVHDANLVSGLITATEIKAVSTTRHDASGFRVRAAGSRFVDLVVNGIPISGTPAPNTTIHLPGVGRVVLNERIKHVGSSSASLTENMIHVYVTVGLPGVDKGTQIIVSHATSDLELEKAGSLDGVAYGTKAHVGHVLISGRSAVVRMPCGGTHGRVKSNSVASVNLPGIGSTGTVTDTAQGTIDASEATGETTSTVQAADVLSGLVTADLIEADAHASKSGGVISLSDEGSHFVNLVVDGQPIAGDVAANTRIRVDGLTIWLHRVITSSNNIEVRMIEIVVKRSNPFGLDIGTDIQVAVAEASVH
jgi:hypothetical protein